MERRRHNTTRPTAKSWKCDNCQSTFRRMDHMKRHALTRTSYVNLAWLQSNDLLQITQRRSTSVPFAALLSAEGV